jgi:hypothetical protein
MKALLICPAGRPGVELLAESTPLVLVPLLGKTLLDYWLDHLSGQGVKQVCVLATDRPDQVRAWLGDGVYWELKVEVIEEAQELAPAQARAKYRRNDDDWLAEPHDVAVMDYLPGDPDWPLFDSYAGWFVGVKHWLPRVAAERDRVGLREIKPGVWVGLRSRIASDAELSAPCWIGENVLVGSGAVLGSGAIVENGVVIGDGAEIADSIVGPETFVGELTEVKNSLAWGSTLINWRTDSCTHVPDTFLLCGLNQRPRKFRTDHWPGRLAAIFCLALTCPFALYAAIKARLLGQPALRPLVAVRPQTSIPPATLDTLVYHEFSAVKGWLRRWPQLWKVARGEFAWVGNRPLNPADAAALSTEFDRLWLRAPIGLFSLSDAEAHGELSIPDVRAQASYYAVNAGWRLDLSILNRIFGRRYARRITLDDQQ